MPLKKPAQSYCSIKGMVNGEVKAEELPGATKLYQNAIAISWPAAVEAALVSIGNSIDTAVVGTLGTTAMNAVGITSQPRLIVQCFSLSLNIGVTAVIARYKGAGDRQGANRCFRQALLLSLAVSLAPALLAGLFANPLLRLAGASSEFLADSIAYFRIMLTGLSFYCIGLTICAAQRGVGNTKTSMAANISANIVKISLAYCLIGGHFGFPALGLTGAALAAMLSYLVGFGTALYSVLGRANYLGLRQGTGWKFDCAYAGGIIRVGASALCEQLFSRFGMLIYIRLVSGLGAVAYASYIICDSVLSVAYSVCNGLSAAASALVGQAIGGKRRDLAVVYGGISRRICCTISLAFALVYVLGSHWIVALFSADPQVIILGSRMMLMVAMVSLIQSYQMIYSGCLRGGGDTKYVAMLSLVSLAILRPILSWVLCYPLGLGILGAWLSMLLDQFGRSVMLRHRFLTGNWVKGQL